MFIGNDEKTFLIANLKSVVGKIWVLSLFQSLGRMSLHNGAMSNVVALSLE